MLLYAGDSEDELDDDEPHLETVMVQHPAAVNRIRVSFSFVHKYICNLELLTFSLDLVMLRPQGT